MSAKTLAMLILEGNNVTYQVHQYDDSLRDAEIIAQQVGLEPAKVYKTLVVKRSSSKPLLVMIPADKQLDLKQTARAVGEKKVRMASHSEAEKLTNLEVGGISALALLNRGFEIYLDTSANEQETICISAGKRGAQLEVAVADLVRVTGARLATVAR